MSRWGCQHVSNRLTHRPAWIAALPTSSTAPATAVIQALKNDDRRFNHPPDLSTGPNQPRLLFPSIIILVVIVPGIISIIVNLIVYVIIIVIVIVIVIAIIIIIIIPDLRMNELIQIVAA